MRSLAAIMLSSVCAFGQMVSVEDGWKGIEVFKSTRTDVEKALASPPSEGLQTIYRTDLGNVEVIYAKGPCVDPETFTGDFNLPKDTVVAYSVYFAVGIPFEQIKFTKADYRRSESPTHRNQVSYFNGSAGIWMIVEAVDDHETLLAVRNTGSTYPRATVKCNVLKS